MVAEARRLVLLRHGRTAWNAADRAQGHADVELDGTGHEQAAHAAAWVAASGPAVLWTSDLRRALQTAAYVEKETGLAARPDARLREHDMGEATGLTPAELSARRPGLHDAWRRSGPEVVPGAESRAEVAARVVPACRELVSSLSPGATAVAVTHGGTLKVATVALLGWGLSAAGALHGLHNCGAAVLQEGAPDGPMRLVAWNVGADFAWSGAGG